MKNIFIILLIALIGIGGIFFIRNFSPPEGGHETRMARETLSIKGSDTLVQLVSNLVEAFAKENPGVRISVTGGGSGTGIAALLNGQIPIANSSRSIKEEELAQAKEGGLYIQEFIVAREGLSVIVSPQNPVSEVTMEQLGKIYRAEITNWKEIGGKDQAIVLYGRQTGSGTYVFFKEKVVKGDYALTMKNMEGNQAIVDAIKADRQGIGYVGIGYVVDEPGKLREGIKVLKISLTP